MEQAIKQLQDNIDIILNKLEQECEKNMELARILNESESKNSKQQLQQEDIRRRLIDLIKTLKEKINGFKE